MLSFRGIGEYQRITQLNSAQRAGPFPVQVLRRRLVFSGRR
jgi:hypothetical protein